MLIFKRPHLYDLVDKINLWPSRSGLLHGVKEAENLGSFIRITTYCGKAIMAKPSKRSRSARWLRNHWKKEICAGCAIPTWKVERYARTAS
jgi:pyrrolysyl-tRNA synthetase-like protein